VSKDQHKAHRQRAPFGRAPAMVPQPDRLPPTWHFSLTSRSRKRSKALQKTWTTSCNCGRKCCPAAQTDAV